MALSAMQHTAQGWQCPGLRLCSRGISAHSCPGSGRLSWLSMQVRQHIYMVESQQTADIAFTKRANISNGAFMQLVTQPDLWLHTTNPTCISCTAVA